MSLQKTIREPATVEGRGLFSGEMCRLSFMPAPENAGITFVRNDLPSPVRIETNVANLAKRARRTSLKNGAATVETIEHVLAAVWGLGIDNLTIELSADETPAPDASPMPFVEALQRAGIAEQQAEEASIYAAYHGRVTKVLHGEEKTYHQVDDPGRKVVGVGERPPIKKRRNQQTQRANRENQDRSRDRPPSTHGRRNGN